MTLARITWGRLAAMLNVLIHVSSRSPMLCCCHPATPCPPHVHPVSTLCPPRVHPVCTPCPALVPMLLPGAVVDQESMPLRAACSVGLCI